MPAQLGKLLDRLMTPPAMPPGAHLPGLLGRSPAVRAAMETEWRRMALEMFAGGIAVGLAAAVVLALAVASRDKLGVILRGAIDAIR